MNDPSIVTPVVQVLLLVVTTLLTILSTVAIVMQLANKKALQVLANDSKISFNEVARDVKEVGTKLSDHTLLVARDYMTHAQHIEFHRIEGKLSAHDA